MVGVKVDLLVGDPVPLERLLARSGCRRHLVEHSAHSSALHTTEGARSPVDRVGSNATLTVRRPGQGDQRHLSRHEVLHFHCVAHSPDVGVRRAHLLVDLDPSQLAELKSSLLGQLGLRADTDAKDGDFAWVASARLSSDLKAGVSLVETGDAIAQAEVDALGLAMLVKDLSHFWVHGREDLSSHLDNGHLNPAMHEVLSGLKANEASAHNHRALDLVLIHPSTDLHTVWDGAQEEDSGEVDAGKRRADGEGTRSKHKSIVALGRGRVLSYILYLHSLGLRVDLDHLVLSSHVNLVAVLEESRGCKNKILVILDDVSDVVGETAVGKGHEGSLLEDSDGGVLVQPAETSSCRGTAGNTTNNDNLLRQETGCAAEETDLNPGQGSDSVAHDGTGQDRRHFRC
mmetsp:Transcript_2885/g.9719  ORF Transcript_2885/g.9719 Transcript_2885/m.9719 type:complete len:401 (-) Transcript_2885:150-1352(-)